MRPLQYWRDEHPLGCTGLKRYSAAISDLEAGSAFFQDFTRATFLYAESRAAANARAVGLRIADSIPELITPVDDGPIARFQARFGDGIRSLVFSVRDLSQAQTYFASRNITLHPGDAPNTLAIAEDNNRGLRFEFSQ